MKVGLSTSVPDRVRRRIWPVLQCLATQDTSRVYVQTVPNTTRAEKTYKKWARSGLGSGGLVRQLVHVRPMPPVAEQTPTTDA